MKEGNKNEFHGEGGIGLIASRLTLEGPIGKNKNISYMISGRRTYADVVLSPFVKAASGGSVKAGYYFYDATRGVENELDNRVEFDEESEDFVYGAGVGANLGEKLNLRLEYEKYDLQGLDDADALWLNAAWRF